MEFVSTSVRLSNDVLAGAISKSSATVKQASGMDDQPEGVTSIPLEQRIMPWAILLGTIGGAGYLLFRYRSHLRGAAKFAIATIIIAVVRVARYLRAEASDIRMQVTRGLDQSDPREGQTLTTANQDHAPGRLRLAGRMFFNLAIAPLLLGGVLAWP